MKKLYVYVNYMRLILILFFFFVSTVSSAQDIYFAGFSFIGNASEDDNYPVAIKLYREDKLLLDKQLATSLKRLQRKDLNIITSELGTIKSGNAVVLAYGLQRESIATYQVEGEFQYIIDITGLIYVFDYSEQEKKLLASFPTGMTVSVNSKNRLSREELNKYVENMYVPNRHQLPNNITFESGNGSSSVFDSWVVALEKAKISRASKDIRLQIRHIILDEAVLNQLPRGTTAAYIKDDKTLISETARNLERNLSAYQQLPVIPFSVGRALGANMIGRFGDTDYQIKLPQPDFVIDVLVREFKKSVIKNKVYDGWIFGSFITLKLVEPVSNSVKLESKFNYKDEIKVPTKYNLVFEDDWPSWIGAQKKLFEILSKQITARHDTELANITNTSNIKDLLINFEEVINKCR